MNDYLLLLGLTISLGEDFPKDPFSEQQLLSDISLYVSGKLSDILTIAIFWTK
jgi:hypothetical protein